MRDERVQKVTTVRSGQGRQTMRIGDARVMDVVVQGPEMLVEYKGSRKDPVRANAKDVLQELNRIIDRDRK